MIGSLRPNHFELVIAENRPAVKAIPGTVGEVTGSDITMIIIFRFPYMPDRFETNERD